MVCVSLLSGDEPAPADAHSLYGMTLSDCRRGELHMQIFICQRFGFRTVDRNSKQPKFVCGQCDNRAETSVFSVKEYKVETVGS